MIKLLTPRALLLAIATMAALSACKTSSSALDMGLTDSLNLGFEQITRMGRPLGWYAGGGGGTNREPEDYRGSIDPSVKRSGKHSLRMQYVQGKGGVATNGLDDLRPYQGKKIRFSAWVKTSDVKRAWLWFRTDDAANKVLDMSYSPDLVGTHDWTRLENTIMIAPTAVEASFGFLIDGPGDAWVDDYMLEIVP